MALLTVSDAAVLLKLTPATVRRYCASGLIPGALRLCMRGNWRIPDEAISRIIGGKVTPPKRKNITKSDVKTALALIVRQERQAK